MTYLERQELNSLSKEAFGRTSFWQNKLLKKYPLDSFDQMKERILTIKEQSKKLMEEMKQSATVPHEAFTLSLDASNK